MSVKDFYYLLIVMIGIFYLPFNTFSQESPKKTESATSKNEAEQSAPAIPPKDLIHFGDIIDVDIIGSTEYDWRGRINPEGYLDGLDFIESPVFALCRNAESVAADVAKGYEKLLRNPKVSVRIIDRTGRPNSYLYGAVKSPHRFLLQRQVHLNELIFFAGGLTDKASGEIQILRPLNLNCVEKKEESTEDQESSVKKVSTVSNSQNETKIINIKIADLLKGEKDANPIITNGDIITVREAFPIYVIGGVLNPKQINASEKITVSRAIAAAGGLTKNAEQKNVSIFRRNNADSKIIKINLENIKSGQEEDIPLQKYDIVEVMQSGSEKRKFPPVIPVSENTNKKSSDIPLRIIR